MIIHRIYRFGSSLNGQFYNNGLLNAYRFSKQKQNPENDSNDHGSQQPQNKQNKVAFKSINYGKLKKQLEKGKKSKEMNIYLRRMNNGYAKKHLHKLNWFKQHTELYKQVQKQPQDKSSFSNFIKMHRDAQKVLTLQDAFRYLGISLIILALLLGFLEEPSDNKNSEELEKLLDSPEDEKKLLTFLTGIKKIYITPKKISVSQEEKEADKQGQKNQNQNDATKINIRKQIARIKRSWTSYNIQMIDQSGKMHSIQSYEGDPNELLYLFQKLQENVPKSDKAEVFFKNPESYSLYQAFSQTLRLMAPFLMLAIPIYIFRKSSPDTFIRQLGQGKKDFKIKSTKNIKVKFDDVAGMEQAKKQITQFVDFLKFSDKYKDIGAKIPKGALLTGPPGTGKTMLAKACAGEADVSFFYISGSEFVEIFVGLGASKVRDLFDKARQEAPSIIFIDQIDAIGKKRENSRNQQKDSTLNQLLVEMDGFSSSQTVIVLAATNRKQTLDSALTRPGRFDRMVQVNLPDVKARQLIFMVHLKPLKLSDEITAEEIAKRMADLSPGFSGADIANLCNEAAIIASRKGSKSIVQKDFQEAAQRITAGYVKTNLVNKKTRRRVALHEAGHAVSSWFLKGGDPLVKLTIIPRSKGALGYAQYLPKASFIKARDELIDKVAIMLGGITSEQIFYGNMSSGGSDDLQKVYDLTRKMVTQFGMGVSTYNMTMDQQSYVQKQSVFLSDIMDAEVNLLLEEARNRCKSILTQKKDIIQTLANALLEKETLNNNDILEIMGERPEYPTQDESVKKDKIL